MNRDDSLFAMTHSSFKFSDRGPDFIQDRSFRTLLESLPVPLLVTDPSGIILHANAAVSRRLPFDFDLIGHTTADIIGLDNPQALIHAVHKTALTFAAKGQAVRGWVEATRFPFENHDDTILLTFEGLSLDKPDRSSLHGTDVIRFEDILGTSSLMDEVKRQAARIVRGSSTILINGESGTGKELFARAIHHTGDRRDQPFIPINCAAIPDALLESELFGYEEGAFTGAKKGGKPGKFELANHGTIFLDEIGDLKLSLQAKLLRVLQENAIERVGGRKRIPIDVRVISATHDELHEKMDRGEFRADLFYRLSVIPIRIPPLRHRRADIPVIARAFLQRFSHVLDKPVHDFSEEVAAILSGYVWPGNVRELENVVEYAVNMTSSEIIGMEDLPIRFVDPSHRSKPLTLDHSATGVRPIEALEQAEIEKALRITGRGKQDLVLAAGMLGISLSTLYRRLRKYRLD